MNTIEKRIEELYAYQPYRTSPPDLDAFWERVKQLSSNESSFASRRSERETLFHGVNVYDVQYEGFEETTIHGLYMVPQLKSLDKTAPCLITFPGYTGGKGDPEDYAHLLLMGYAVFAVDVRGQGGDTGNRLPMEHGGVKGWITQNILDVERCYYKAIAVDALRAVTWLSEQLEIDSGRIGVIGGSQGGGLALITAAMHEQIRLCVADIPNMCHMDYGVMHSTGSLSEVADFCRRFPEHMVAVLRHLSYFDMLNLSDRLHVPLLMSVGLKDTVCLPEQIVPVYRSAASEIKRIEFYPFTGHAVEKAQRRIGMQFIHQYL
ncbi:acetylxylan esterase [Marinicrinis lubricantis]|uniref:Acetylxylan esterase n=1 Tax=Marinicrinis lubricantis TaxID=2086470 RepID=A0ABW1IP20_9BACL